MSRKVRRYTKEFKQEAVTLALKSPSISRTATELGLPMATLHSWIQQLKGKPLPTQSVSDDAPDITTLVEENRRLHKELAIAREEKEILKKAATYFAQHQK
jgi:transposase